MPVTTLAVDIGGTGIKAILLDAEGNPLTERSRVRTPRPATPQAVVAAVVKLAGEQGMFDRVSVGFPGVVRQGVVHTAPNLDGSWQGMELAQVLEKLLHKPVRVANDADVQGLGVIQGRGVELVITLGTGVGSALFVDGRLVPNLELAHHPFHGDKTYEEELGAAALHKVGKKKWNHRLSRAVAVLSRVFNYDVLYIGGGNAKKVALDLGPNVKLVSNMAGLLGGIACWQSPDEQGRPD
ncbi:MAG: ROK family protein [Nitrospirae bacterium]|nr:MAG: ROK family protein [Nitrospirota bacterium]